MVAHLISHKEIKPFKCKICQTSFGEEKNLFRHVGIVHCKLKLMCDNPKISETNTLLFDRIITQQTESYENNEK